MSNKLRVRIFFLLMFFFMCNSNKVVAQNNYVPNGDFEIIDTCPNVNIQPYRSIYYAKPWFQPYLPDNSSDLFNLCDTASNALGVPNNYFGSQAAESGVGYSGINIGSGGPNVREYLEVELLYTMQQGREYCISLYVCLSEWGRYV